MLRQRATQADTPSDEADVGRVDRTPLNAAMSLGWLYGTLNQVAPLIRLYSIVCLLVIRSESTAGGVLWPQVAAVASNVAGKPLQRLAGALVPGDKESSSFHRPDSW